jgi:type IV pilus assembly protein PilW
VNAPHLQYQAMGQRGFSLVELMVAMGLSLLLLAGALSILYSTRVSYSENERLSRLQEGGRTTMELISRDLRGAGFNGCNRIYASKYKNRLVNPTSLLWDFPRPVNGFNANATDWTPALDGTLVPSATQGSDVLVIRTSRQGMPIFRTSVPVTNISAPIAVTREPNQTVVPGQTLMISDCEYTTVFVATDMTAPGTTAATISHDTTAIAGKPVNLADDIGAEFTADSLVTTLDTVIYYVRPMDAGAGPGLWQKVGENDPQLLVEGVENLQVRFGVDSAGNDLLVDEYVDADAVTAAQWDKIVSVSIAALIRSEQETGSETDEGQYDLLGQTFGPFSDRRQRAVYTTTIALRNASQ